MPAWREIASIEGLPLQGGAGRARILERHRHGLLLEVRFSADAASPAHAHDHDSYLYLLEGRLTTTVAGSVRVVEPGESVVHPAGVEHSVTALADSRWLEFKSPPPTVVEDGSGRLDVAPPGR
jgi:quercetin dioxygenase-like cupin family protein